jgi:hypothetical protein
MFKQVNAHAAAGAVLCLLAAGGMLASGDAMARGADEASPETICTVLGTASRYVGTTVTVRGQAFNEGKDTLLGDAQCKGSVSLSISDSSSMKRDVSSFRRVVGGKGVHADATVFGRFKATGDAAHPYTIDVYSVRNVNEIEAVAEGT